MTSYGIIVKHNTESKFLLVQRRDSHSYLSFFKYFKIFSKIDQENCFKGMTLQEKEKLLTYDFDTLWADLYTDVNSFHYNVQKNYAAHLFDLFKKSPNAIQRCKESSSSQLEWGFPKGCINYNEEPLFCALREFKEETTIPYENIQILKNQAPLTTHLYNKACIFYPATACDEFKFNYTKTSIRDKFLSNETQDAKWFTIEEIQAFSWVTPKMISFLKNLDSNK